jgi:hypothetical protein
MTAIVSKSIQPQWQPAKAGVSALIWALAVIVVPALTILSTEPTLTFACLVVLIVGAHLLWRPGEPPILFAAFFMQWLQISLSVFHASVYGVSLQDLLLSRDGIDTATWLSLAGLVVLAGGVRLMLRGIRWQAWTQLITEVREYSLRKAFIVYLIAQIMFLGIETVTWWSPGLAQPLFALTNLRWVFFYLIATIVFIKKRGYSLLIMLFLFELVRGFLSFFAEFTEVFLVAGIAFMGARPKINVWTVAMISGLLAGFLVLAAAWSEVKIRYRDYLNGGSGRQVVLVGPLDRLNRISDLMLNDGLANLSRGFDLLARRIEYTYFFGRVVDQVPSVLPYDYGAFWGDAVLRVLTPRLVFSEKGPLIDVTTTAHYTGLKLAWVGNQATEIPMGYMAESYIDFGPVGMFVPIFLLGLLFGAQYRYLVERPRYLLFVYGAAPVILMPMSQFGMSSAKNLGGNITSFIVFYVTLRLVVPYIHRLISISPVRTVSAASSLITN